MMRKFWAVAGGMCLAATAVFALQLSDLSPAARAMLTPNQVATVTLKDGKTVEGEVVTNTPDRLVLRVEMGGTITTQRTIKKSEIKAAQEVDPASLLGTKLLEVELDHKQSLPEDELQSYVALFDEYLEKCKGDPNREAVAARRAAFTNELAMIRAGMEKIDGEWFSPVLATVRKYDKYTEEIATIRKKPEFRESEKLRREEQDLQDKRREAARSLPKMMQDRVPLLIDERKFDEATAETTGFLQFWVSQVVSNEVPMKEVTQKMDFGYILNMQRRIVDGYWAAQPAQAAPEAARENDMAYVPGGYFLMGRQDAQAGEPTFPMHIVFVSPYLIDRHEVCNEDYREFVEYVKKTGDSSMEHSAAPPLNRHEPVGWERKYQDALGRDRQPVVGVDWFDAYAYARWKGRRLPTEAEWERAARGAEARVYAWGGSNALAAAVNWAGGRRFLAAEMDRQNPPKPIEPQGAGCACVKKADLPPPPPTVLPAQPWDADKSLPPDALQAVTDGFLIWSVEYPSACGALHMAGNAAEWVYDFFDPRYYAKSPLRNPQGPDEDAGQGHVIRGGSYLSERLDEITTFWRAYPTDDKMAAGCTPGYYGGQPFVGFRCAKSLDIAGGGK